MSGKERESRDYEGRKRNEAKKGINVNDIAREGRD